MRRKHAYTFPVLEVVRNQSRKRKKNKLKKNEETAAGTEMKLSNFNQFFCLAVANRMQDSLGHTEYKLHTC